MVIQLLGDAPEAMLWYITGFEHAVDYMGVDSSDGTSRKHKSV